MTSRPPVVPDLVVGIAFLSDSKNKARLCVLPFHQWLCEDIF